MQKHSACTTVDINSWKLEGLGKIFENDNKTITWYMGQITFVDFS